MYDGTLSQGSVAFRPPIGLQPNENVLWVQGDEHRSSGWKGSIIISLFGGLFFAIGLLANALVMAGFGALFLLLGVYVAYQFKTTGDSRYYLTNFRFIKTIHGRIKNELSRRVLRGRSFNQFLRVYPAPNRVGLLVMYSVQVLNPETGSVAMNLGLLPEEVVKRLESINDEVYCQYCGRKNEPLATNCANCGANL